MFRCKTRAKERTNLAGIVGTQKFGESFGVKITLK